jgi:hypothetical protein
MIIAFLQVDNSDCMLLNWFFADFGGCNGEKPVYPADITPKAKTIHCP